MSQEEVKDLHQVSGNGILFSQKLNDGDFVELHKFHFDVFSCNL